MHSVFFINNKSQKNNMYYLIMHAGYSTFQVGLYNNHQLLDHQADDKKNACKQLISIINTLLHNHDLRLNNLDFIGVNQGPGPFTTLRITITTANGLAFATGIPLVGVNSQYALLHEYRDTQWPLSIVILNAFNHDLYYAIEYKKTLNEGCKNHELLLHELKEKYPGQPIRFLGNGASLYKPLIISLFGSDAFIPDPLPEEPSLNGLAECAREYYAQKKIHSQLLPIYLKELSYRPII